MIYQDFVDTLKEKENVENVCKQFYMKARRDMFGNIYKFYSLNGDIKLNNKKLKCLEDKRIYAACRSEFNDPYDDKGYIYNKKIVEKCAEKHGFTCQLEDIYPDFKRICCFTKSGFNNISMWAHYANNHRGYCVEYAKENNFSLYAMLLPVVYVKQKIDLTDMICSRLEMVEKQRNTKLLENALEQCSIFLSCLKHDSWKNEKEIRFIYPKKHPEMPLQMAMPCKVYIGSMCPSEYKDRLIQISRKLNVPVYKMEFDEQAIEYKLKTCEL